MQNKKFIIFLKKDILSLFLILFVFFVFLQEFNIFRNIYYLLNKNHDQRATNAYEKTFFSGYCEGSSHGYLFYIKNKYPQKIKNEIPKIINDFNGKKEYWIFLDVNKKINEDQIILLNNLNIENFSNFTIIDEYKNNCFFLEKK